MGCLSFYDSIIGDGDIPSPRLLGKLSNARIMAKYNTTQHLQFEDVSDEECWEALQPTLKILEDLAPHVKEWLEEQHVAGKIKYNLGCTGYFATFDCITRDLKIHRNLFFEEDGIKATILAHEWRHSKQNPNKFIKYIMSYALTRRLKTDIVENDAYLYESECRDSLYGKQ